MSTHQNAQLTRFKAHRPLMEQLTAGKLNAMLDAIEAAQTHFGVHSSGYQLPSGAIVRANRAASSAKKIKFPWAPYSSPYTGSGTPPSDQPLRVRTRYGTMDDQIPSNMAEEFLLPASTSTFAWLDVELNDDGFIQALTIDSGTTLPDPPDPPDPDVNGGYIPEFFVPIWMVTCNATSASDFWAFEFTSLSILRTISGWDGQKFTRSIAVSRDPSSLFV